MFGVVFIIIYEQSLIIEAKTSQKTPRNEQSGAGA
jgi:hypothetical protein